MDIALEQAIKEKNIEKVKKILESGVSINKPNLDGLFPIHLASAIPDNKQILQLLIDHGADVNMSDTISNKKQTPLMYALLGIDGKSNKKKIKENLEFLIENEADINITSPAMKNRNVLQLASFFEDIDLDVYQMLINGNGNQVVALDHQDNDGNTALLILISYVQPNPKSSISIDNFAGKLESLMEEGTDLHLKRRSKNVIDIIKELKEKNKQLSDVYEELLEIINYMFDYLYYDIGIDKQNIKYKKNKLAPLSLDYNTIISDPITLERKTITEWLNEPVNNIIFVDENLQNFAVVPRQNLRKLILDQTSIVFKCNRALESTNITPDKVNIEEPFFYTDSIGLGGKAVGSLIQMHELFEKTLYYTPISHPKQHRVFMVSTDHSKKIEPLANSLIINYGNFLNIFSDQISAISEKHCGSGTYGYFATLVPVIKKKEPKITLTGKTNPTGTHEEVIIRSQGGKKKSKKKKSKTKKKTKRRRR